MLKRQNDADYLETIAQRNRTNMPGSQGYYEMPYGRDVVAPPKRRTKKGMEAQRSWRSNRLW